MAEFGVKWSVFHSLQALYYVNFIFNIKSLLFMFSICLLKLSTITIQCGLLLSMLCLNYYIILSIIIGHFAADCSMDFWLSSNQRRNKVTSMEESVVDKRRGPADKLIPETTFKHFRWLEPFYKVFCKWIHCYFTADFKTISL